MSRTVATVWHASLATLAAILYFLFVIPRWWELTGFTPHVLGTVLRISLGVLVGVTALPVLATLRHTRKPEYGTPQLALTLLTGSIVAHVVAGTLIAGTAISEIWLSLDSAGIWLFGIYGAAAAIALLGVGAFYLAFVAEMPPPPPKPIKPKKDKSRKQRRWGKKKAPEGAEGGDETGADQPEADDAETDDAEPDDAADAEPDDAADGTADDAEPDETGESEAPTDDAPPTETTAQAREIVESTGEETPELAPAGARQKPRPSGKRRVKKGE